MDRSQGFVAVDWGTTNRRAYRLDGVGQLVDLFEDAQGVTVTPAGRFAQELATIRARLGDVPVLMAGMVGSTLGWREVPYVACPADLDAVARHLFWMEEHRTAIVPGLSFLRADHADVMRGEEVQLLGLIAQGQGAPQRVCHPGTHTKWAQLSGGAIAEFCTVMTGEMFALLRSHSILAPMLSGPVSPGEAFCHGVVRGYGGGVLTAELFGIRAGVLLSRMAQADAASHASGLLIGADLKAGLVQARQEAIVVLGDPALVRLYCAALAHCGFEASPADGAKAFIAGMAAIAERL